MITNVVTRQVLRSQSLVKVPARTMYPQLSSNVISGPPQVRVPFYEKLAGGIFIGFCVLATPAWVLTHLDEYRGGPVEIK